MNLFFLDSSILYARDTFFKKGAYIFFAIFLCVGCLVYSDYGISTDEEVQRYIIGEANYKYIETSNAAELLANDGKYHGPAFELILYAAEKIFTLKEERDCYLLRHFLTFLTFFVSSICFYLLCLKIFKYHFAALLGVVLLVVAPRIFAESFYNSKDIPMLCFCIISAYTMFLFVEKQTIVLALVHAACCGFAIDIRVMALLIPIATLYLYFFQKEKKGIPLLLYFFYLLIFVIAFWPVFWLGPIHHFIEAFKQMSKYPGNGTILYMGEFVSIQKVPWHYLPVWIGITTPIWYVILFCVGLFFIGKNTLARFKDTVSMQVVIFIFSAPILAVIILQSTVYDAWRHIYFVYPFLVLISVYGLIQFITLIKNKILINSVIYVTFLTIVFVLFFMIKNHPFQNVYFNAFAGNNIRDKYELDYWGLSYKQALEYILENDKSKIINIASDKSDMDLTSWLNFNILPAHEKNRLQYTYDFKSADYFVTNFRWHPKDYNIGNSVYTIEVNGEKIMEVIKLK